jgi:ankyrin repeat protein
MPRTRFPLLSLSLLAMAGGMIAGVASSPAEAQGAGIGSESYRFLEAVRERDINAANVFLNEPGTNIVNTRDVTTGQTALHIVVADRNLPWLNMLLGRGADPRTADRAGLTPLRLAAQVGCVDGAQALLARGANVNQSTANGETALHIAVQRRDIAMVRLLIAAGANPDQPDNVAGKSARDYAQEDRRGAAILSALDARASNRPAGPAVAGPN